MDKRVRKHCPKCKKNLPLKRFGIHRKELDGHYYCCIKCKRILEKKKYSKHKKLYRARHRKYWFKNHRKNKKRLRIYNQKRFKEYRRIIIQYKESHPCVDCGESDPIVLEFDHIKGRKKFTIGKYSGLMAKNNFSPLIREIEKCEIRCANCHRKKHYKTKWEKE